MGKSPLTITKHISFGSSKGNLSDSCILRIFIFLIAFRGKSSYESSFTVKKLKLAKGNYLVECHRDTTWQNWDSGLDFVSPELKFLKYSDHKKKSFLG